MSSFVFNFTIPAGARRSFNLTIIDDNIANKYYNYYYRDIRIDLVMYEAGERVHCDYSYINIDDNDGLHFELLETGIYVDEDVETVELCGVHAGGENVPPVIHATFSGLNNDDIISNTTNFTLATGERLCFNVTIVDDSIIEYTETYRFYFYAANDSTQLYDGTRIRISGNEDNPAFRFGLERFSYTVVESDGVVTVCVTANYGDGTEAVNATLLTRNITTQDGEDHGSLRQEFTVSDSLRRHCFNITIIDDDVAEEDEFFQVFLTSVRRIAGKNIFRWSRYRANVFIIDDDSSCSPECVNGLCRFGVCQCYEGWIDEDCSREICQPPCGENGVCNVNTGYCDCSPGFTGASCDGDIRECEANNGGCDQICTDFPGGYSCSCRSGFETDGPSCTDINECAGDHDCSQICVNTPGSYYCNCQSGFLLVNDTQCEDVDECELISLCGQVCVNTEGSFHCACRDGYRLFGSFFCTDIDECGEKIDNCSRGEPTPARCVNTEGSYMCTCNDYVGYSLSSDDNTTCEDVDECAKNETNLCSEICVNTPGSYNCSCPEGYSLGKDNISCNDIDECEARNGGCQHRCTNIPGSFSCSCHVGYELLEDGFSCNALSCHPVLEAPANGMIECERQTVGETCTFSCEDGYTQRGGQNRTCLPSLQWAEPPARCDPPMCPELVAPENGFVLFPCTREDGDVCRVVCAHGYLLEGPSNQTCEKENGSLVWSKGPECAESNPCSPNPCENDGYCIEEGNDFSCVCNGTATGYTGPTCAVVIVHFPPIPPVTDSDLQIPVTLFTDADNFTKRVTVGIKIPNTEKLNQVVLRVRSEQTTEESVPGVLGIVRITLPRNTATVTYEPRERNVFVTGVPQQETVSYFDQFNLTRGLLRPGCCDSSLQLSCPGTQTVSLLSPCQWRTTNAQVTRTDGLVFAMGTRLSLPTSLSGLRYREVEDRRYSNDIRRQASGCNACNECNGNSDFSCYCYTHTPLDTLDFLLARAMAFTYMSQIETLLPSWLEMFVDLDKTHNSSVAATNDAFAPVTRLTEPVSSVEGCYKLTGLVGSRFSVLRYGKTLSANIDGQRYDYEETSTAEDVMCFAVDLCHESDSPVHMQISQAINHILVTEYLQQFTERGWDIVFHTVSVFKDKVAQESNDPNETFWNGEEMIPLPEFEADISVNVNVVAEFDDEYLRMILEFNGDASFDYIEKQGLLKGEIVLEASSLIRGAQQMFHIGSLGGTEAYVDIGDVNPCNRNSNGLSFTAHYRPQPGEMFFTSLLHFTEITQSCTFKAFIPIDSDYRALGLSVHTQCPLLAIGHLILPEMSHTLTFTGSENPSCLTTNFLGLTHPALVIESELMNSRLLLGNILELQTNSRGPDVVTVFGRNGSSGPVSEFSSVRVTLFGGVFESEAVIRSNQLTLSTSSGSVFGFPAQISISAPSNETDWQDLTLTVEGYLLSEAEGSFVDKLIANITARLSMLAESASKRRKVAEMALDESRERFHRIESQHNQTLERLTEAEKRQAAAGESIETAETRLEEVERQFNESREELQALVDIDSLCTVVVPCKDVCMPGEVCRNCSKPTFITKTSKCPTTVKESRRIRVPPFFVTRTTWQWVIQCRLVDNRICIEEDCPVGVDKTCYGKCVPVVTSRVPVFHWRIVEMEVPSFENCTVQLFNSSVPSTCCENVTCAVRAPDPLCELNNTRCRTLRENKAQNETSIREEGRQLFQQLLEARKNLSLARTSQRRAGVEYERFEQRREHLEMSLDRLRYAVNNSIKVKERTLEEVGPLLKVYVSGRESEYSNIFSIDNITFSEKLINSPTSLVFDMRFQTLIDNSVKHYEVSYLYISSQIEEINLQRFSDGIIQTAFNGDSKRSITWLQTRLRRQTEADLSPREIFDSRCAHISNMQLFFAEIQARLAEVQASFGAAREGTRELSDSLNDQGSSEAEEFQAYLDLIRDYEDLSMEALTTLEVTIFSEWQASMEMLYSESGSVGEISCDGLADCLQTSTDQLLNLISLTPKRELSPEFLSLRPRLPFAVESLLELALFSNLSISEGIDRVSPIIEITMAYAINNYWCNEPPVIVSEPPAEVNVSLGGTLQLSCEAESSLPLTYRWTRDGNVLPQFNTRRLVIAAVQRQDSANYTCFAGNAVGTAQSLDTSVTVYELPEFYLLPQSVATYSGDGNGAWFACNASAWPFPGWRWYHRISPNDDWTIIEGEETNELLVVNPQVEDEGEYVCEAYNYHGSIRSDPVSLTLLPFTVSQRDFPVEFSVFTPNTSCPLEDLYDTLFSLLSETLRGETTVFQDFNITEVDSENYDISLSLVSENVTTRFLHLSTFAEIANSALPHLRSLRKSLQLITDLLEGGAIDLICPGTNSSVIEDSVVVGKLRYVCPPGQRLNSDFLLCLSCEKGHFSSETDHSRVVNGVGFSETVPVCEVCPLNSYADTVGSPVCSQCPKYHTTSFTGTTSLQDCSPQSLVVECEATRVSNHIDIDCRTNRPPQTTFCSFNKGPKVDCSYPLAINRDVSPLGNHTLTIFVRDDEGFEADVTVPYFLEEDSKPTVSAVVPPLTVSFIGDSPRVQEDSVEADILLSRPVQSLICRLKGGSLTTEQDCSGGHVVFSGLSPAVYTLRVVATNRKPDKEFIKVRFEVTDDPERCTLHLINEGVSVRGDSARVEFAGRGPANGYLCHLDKTQSYQCSSPVMLTGLSHGKHVLKVVPTGCGKNRMNLKTTITIE